MKTSPSNKYGSKIVFWDSTNRCVISKEQGDSCREGKRNRLPKHIYRFDSTLEFKVYMKLTQMYSPERVKRQVRLCLVPPGKCCPKGKFWKVDFGITKKSNPKEYEHYVEAKGRITVDFRYTLPMLEYSNPEAFNRLTLVFGSKIPHGNQVISSLLRKDFSSHIYTVGTFNHLHKLK